MRTRSRTGSSHGGIRPLILCCLIGAVLGVGVAIYYYVCPCNRLPGGWLFGKHVSEPIDDWSFANDVPLCQVEVRGWLTHSVNVNCMSSNGALFVSCASCEGKRWSTMALANPNGRIRLNTTVYPVTFRRVEDAAVLDEAWRARERKMGRPEDTPRAAGWWSFKLESR
jgi:hypothetical protein